jgi:hypothetical protein
MPPAFSPGIVRGSALWSAMVRTKTQIRARDGDREIGTANTKLRCSGPPTIADHTVGRAGEQPKSTEIVVCSGCRSAGSLIHSVEGRPREHSAGSAPFASGCGGRHSLLAPGWNARLSCSTTITPIASIPGGSPIELRRWIERNSPKTFLSNLPRCSPSRSVLGGCHTLCEGSSRNSEYC